MVSGHLERKNGLNAAEYTPPPILKQIQDLKTRLCLFKDILSRVPEKWKKWQQLNQTCSQDLPHTVQQLVDLNCHDLARSLADNFRAVAVKAKIEEKFLLHLLTEKGGTLKALNAV